MDPRDNEKFDPLKRMDPFAPQAQKKQPPKAPEEPKPILPGPLGPIGSGPLGRNQPR